MKSHENRQQDLLSEPNAKKQRVLDKDDDDVGSHTEKTDRVRWYLFIMKSIWIIQDRCFFTG